MKKTLLVALAAALVLSCLSLSACGGSSGGSDKTQTAESLSSAMLKATGATERLALLDEKVVNNLYDFDPAFTDDYQVYYNLNGDSVEEISVFHAAGDQKANLKEMLEGRIATVKAQASNYPTDFADQIAMADTAIILEKGDYLALVISAGPDAAQKAFNECF